MKRSLPTLVKQNSFIPLLAVAAVCVCAGCSDPADKVSKAPGSAPQEANGQTAPGAKKYSMLPNSTLGFVASKVTGSHNGGFKQFSGTLSVADGKIVVPTEFKIDLNSVFTDNEKLTGHLKSPDFFDVAKFTVATFTVTSI